MARRRRNQKRKLKATQENTTNDGLATKREDFVWNNERKIALFQCMIKRKPAGKFLQIDLYNYNCMLSLSSLSYFFISKMSHYNMDITHIALIHLFEKELGKDHNLIHQVIH